MVDTAEERAEGLMHRESLPRFSGMLFVYDRPQPVAFWMRNTLIPLDMLFFDAEGRLTRIKSQAQPLDETPVVGGDAVQYVLEINGGLAAELGIDLGAELRHPAVTGAAWSCADWSHAPARSKPLICRINMTASSAAPMVPPPRRRRAVA